jgi:hypothetical protein
VGEEDLAELDLQNPVGSSNSKGCLLEFLDKDGSSLAALVVGREHARIGDAQVADGRFVRILGERTVCVVPYLFPEAGTDGSLWLDRSFPACKLTRRLVMRDGQETVWGFVRANRADAMTMISLPAGETLDPEVVSQLEYAVGYAQFSRVASPDQKSKIPFVGRVFEFETFDGFVYTWQLSNILVDGRLLPVKVDVSLAKEVKSTKKMSERLRCEKAHYRDWVYLLPRSTFAPLQMGPKMFLKATR